MRRATTKHNGAVNQVCYRCLQFIRKSMFHLHEKACASVRAQITELPPAGTTLKFDSPMKCSPVDFYLVADFETYECVKSSFPLPAEPKKLPEGSEKLYPWVSYQHEAEHVSKCQACNIRKPCLEMEEATCIEATLEPLSYGLKVVDGKVGTFPLVIYSGPNPVRHFIGQLKKTSIEISNILNTNVPIQWTPETRLKHKQAILCFLCRKPFTDADPKVADHLHSTGAWRSSLHRSCNILWNQKAVDLLLHNGSSKCACK